MAWVALHNLKEEPVLLNAGHQVGTLEAAEVVEPSGDAAGARPLEPGGTGPQPPVPCAAVSAGSIAGGIQRRVQPRQG